MPNPPPPATTEFQGELPEKACAGVIKVLKVLSNIQQLLTG
jgi:hypothetical protein